MKAIVIGATGLVGKKIVRILLNDPFFDEVLVFARRGTGFSHSKFREEIVDFENFSAWKDKVRGDVLFSALGTTIKEARSKAAQYKIDHDYQFMVAKEASLHGVKKYVLISSTGASSQSLFFYLRMKGELEDKIKTTGFTSISVLRPGPLKGHRERKRASEILSAKILGNIPQFLLPSTMTFVESERVARIAVEEGKSLNSGVRILEAAEILKFV